MAQSLSNLPVRVLKLGGSLLDLADLPVRFRTWHASQPTGRDMIVVGGGQVVEAVRDLDRCHDLDANLCHWTCVDLLESTAELAAKILGGLPVIDSLDQLREAETLSPVIVRVSAFYRRDSHANWGLPETWETTTDSLAACLAQAVGASELVLLKSCGESESLVAAGAGYGAEHRHVKLKAWSDAGWVDDAFSLCARDIPQIRMVDLRNALE